MEAPGVSQHRPEGVVNRPLALDEVCARIALGAKLVGNGRGGLGRIEQGVFEQDGLPAALQLARSRRRCCSAEGPNGS